MTDHAQQAPIFDDAVAPDPRGDDLAGPSLVARLAAEAVGTFILVLLGVGAALFLSVGGNGTLTVAFGFAVGVIIATVVFGRVSGAHINPAVTVGTWLAGRFPGRDVAPYVLAQVVGASMAGLLLWGLVATHPDVTDARTFMDGGANGFGDQSPAGFGLAAALVVEAIAAALLVAVVLAVTSRGARSAGAPYAVGLAMGFLVLIAMPFTNGAVNPARATGLALVADTWALTQLWAFWLAPLVGAAIAGVLVRVFGPEEDLLTADEPAVEELDAEPATD